MTSSTRTDLLEGESELNRRNHAEMRSILNTQIPGWGNWDGGVLLTLDGQDLTLPASYPRGEALEVAHSIRGLARPARRKHSDGLIGTPGEWAETLRHCMDEPSRVGGGVVPDPGSNVIRVTAFSEAHLLLGALLDGVREVQAQSSVNGGLRYPSGAAARSVGPRPFRFSWIS